MRAYWKGDGGIIGEFAQRLTGSSDLYERSGRRPHASINFITCHDGFTLHDLVTYNEKHNEANLEDNRDGSDNNRSWNCGVEGETDDPGDQRAARAAEAQLHRDAVPLAGRADDARRRRARPHAARQQQRLLPGQRDLLVRLDARRRRSERQLEFFIAHDPLRREHPIFHRRHFFQGRPIRGSSVKDIVWLDPDGGEMTDADWRESHARCLGVYLLRRRPHRDRRARPAAHATRASSCSSTRTTTTSRFRCRDSCPARAGSP